MGLRWKAWRMMALEVILVDVPHTVAAVTVLMKSEYYVPDYSMAVALLSLKGLASLTPPEPAVENAYLAF